MKKKIFILWAAFLFFSACSRDVPMVNLGIDDIYYIPRMSKLPLESTFSGDEFKWKVNGKIVSTDRRYIFLAEEEGTYDLSFDIIDPATPYHFDFMVNVLHEEVEYSPYISKVYEYCPAPGQFVNEMPLYEKGDTYASILQKAEESVRGTNDIMITLGGFGGYVTFGFDHTVINVLGEKDLRIWGNCFYELLDPDRKGGSSEPGIVMVSYDTNCNGLPDDEWYELAGSEYHSPETYHGYKISYTRPDPARDVIPDEENSLTDLHYIGWSDNMGNSGFMAKNIFHSQEYFPQWIKEDEISFGGTLLHPNGVDISGNGSYYVLYSYPWGYVDNHPNDYEYLNSFDISWAVDSSGNPVELPGVDFVRVYTGMNQYCGWLGETSTELCRAADLHVRESGVVTPVIP